jgi:predicted RNase H-like HicB family nuclease
MFGGCHGDDELSVFKELCQMVDEVIELYKEDNKPLPRPTAGHDLVNKLQSFA